MLGGVECSLFFRDPDGMELEVCCPADAARRSRPSLVRMCRNITTLRGLEPEATSEEIEAAARQYVRKISGVQSTSAKTEKAFERAVKRITAASEALLSELPPRQNPPPTLPPLRRIAARQTAAR